MKSFDLTFIDLKNAQGKFFILIIMRKFKALK